MKTTKPFIIYPDSHIYIFCPAGVVTGGPELLHQLCSALMSKGFSASMFYYGESEKSTPLPYQKYHCSITDVVVDDPANIMIIPEIATNYIFYYKTIRKLVWWLSVDNYNPKCTRSFKGFIGNTFPFLKKRNRREYIFSLFDPHVSHAVQSQYAARYIMKHAHIKPFYLSDYLNSVYLETFATCDFRKDLIFFNPKKGSLILKQLIQLLPEFTWIPLINMTAEQIKELMLKGKLYIDFGNHPGKDRFPREAAMQGCCVITGMKGSAKFFEDIPIPQKYKIDDNQDIHVIASRVKDTMTNYHDCFKDFSNYREIIRKEPLRFQEDINHIFIQSN